MTQSTVTLATMKTRVEEMLKASGASALWGSANMDEAIRLSLEQVSRYRPKTGVSKVSPITSRENDVSALDPLLLAVTQVWYPYDSTAAVSWPPKYCEFEYFVTQAGTQKIILKYPGTLSSSPTNEARCFYTALQEINGLGSSSSTTFDQADEGLIALGAAGYACLMRSVDLNETAGNMYVSTPNYGALAEIYLQEFRGILGQQPQPGASRGTRI